MSGALKEECQFDYLGFPCTVFIDLAGFHHFFIRVTSECACWDEMTEGIPVTEHVTCDGVRLLCKNDEPCDTEEEYNKMVKQALSDGNDKLFLYSVVSETHCLPDLDALVEHFNIDPIQLSVWLATISKNEKMRAKKAEIQTLEFTVTEAYKVIELLHKKLQGTVENILENYGLMEVKNDE